MDTAFFHDSHFCLSCIVFTTHDRSSVSHSTTFWSSLTCDETNNWFFRTACFVPSCSFCFQLTSDLTDHNYSFRFRIVDKQFQSFFSCSSDDWVTTDTNCS